MTKTTAITNAITTLAEADRRFNLHRIEEEQFFPEWWENLPDVTAAEQASLEQMRRRYLYHRSIGALLEGTVMLLVASPLLAIAGFYDPPFRICGEKSVQITLDDGEEVLQGRIDVLVLQNQFWLLVLESKKSVLSAWVALPQALSYLMANPHPEKPVFGMITNGDDILFVKLTQADTPRYGLSRVFAPFVSVKELYGAMQVLKRVGQGIA